MPDYGLNAGLPQTPASLPDKEFSLLLPLYQALNNLSQAVSNYAGLTRYTQLELASRNQLGSVQSQRQYRLFVYAPSLLAYGKFVHLYLDSGKIAAEYADATDDTKPACGIVNAPFDIEAGAYGEVILTSGVTQGVSGTTLGATYYLSTTGDISTTRPGVAGSIIQAVGIGLGSAGFYMNISSLFIKN